MLEPIERALKLYRSVVDESYLKAIKEGVQVIERRGIYSSSVVMWLMMFQRLNPDHSLAGALEKLREGDFDELLGAGSIAARFGRISQNTGGYSRARSRVSVEQVEQTADALSAALTKNHKTETLPNGQRVFVVDGTTLLSAFTPENVKEYPQYYNQYGKSHYPLIRTCIATNAITGIVLRPTYGPHNGGKACDEIFLAEQLLERIPKGSLIIGDRFFGCCRFAARVKEARHEVVVRIKELNAKKYIGVPSTDSGEIRATWKSNAGKEEPEYTIEGRFIWQTVYRDGFRPLKLVLFTTSSLPLKEIVRIYGLRWNVELDLRDIKSTLKLDMLYAKTPAMGEKELILGIAAYNLVRHVIVVSAKILNVTPREFSFSRTLKRIVAGAARAHQSEEAFTKNRGSHLLLTDAKSLLLPHRSKERPSEPRKIWLKSGGASSFTRSRKLEQALLKKRNAAL